MIYSSLGTDCYKYSYEGTCALARQGDMLAARSMYLMERFVLKYVL